MKEVVREVHRGSRVSRGLPWPWASYPTGRVGHGVLGLKDVLSEPKARNAIMRAHGQGATMDGWGAICP
jgi:hypothetical protein